MGYQYTHIGYWPNNVNKYANFNYSKGHTNFTTRHYLYSFKLPNFLIEDIENPRCEVANDQMELIKTTLQNESPQFIFWHSFVTHPPYIYNLNGSCRKRQELTGFSQHWTIRKAHYLAQIKVFNQNILNLIDHIQKNSNREVIFVIQSDEGPYPQSLLQQSNDMPYNFFKTSNKELKRKHSIFNAIYLPGKNYDKFDQQLTPINNFRLIFSDILDKKIPLKEHKVYTFEKREKPYQLHEVTPRLIHQDSNEP